MAWIWPLSRASPSTKSSALSLSTIADDTPAGARARESFCRRHPGSSIPGVLPRPSRGSPARDPMAFFSSRRIASCNSSSSAARHSPRTTWTIPTAERDGREHPAPLAGTGTGGISRVRSGSWPPDRTGLCRALSDASPGDTDGCPMSRGECGRVRRERLLSDEDARHRFADHAIARGHASCAS